MILVDDKADNKHPNSQFYESGKKWYELAACKGAPAEFFITNSSSSPLNINGYFREYEKLSKGVEICRQLCPVVDECGANLKKADRDYTVRGGLYPRGIENALAKGLFKKKGLLEED